jgi:UDP-N-acetylglucosamine acyltransferase
MAKSAVVTSNNNGDRHGARSVTVANRRWALHYIVTLTRDAVMITRHVSRSRIPASPMQIHPTALVESGARLGEACIIHAYAVIRRHCVLDDGVVVHGFALVGGDPQDLGFDVANDSTVHVGARTIIREHVTISRATRTGASTEIGADCLLMNACHVAHDCRVGDRVVIASAALLGGHVHVGDGSFLGGGAVIHQFCRIGEGAMIGGGARISRDVPPFTMVTERNALIGLNKVGLRRRGLDRAALDELKRALRIVATPIGNLREQASAALARGEFASPEARRLLEFYQEGRSGFVRPRRGASEPDYA